MNWDVAFGIVNYAWNFGIALGIIVIIKKLDNMEFAKRSKNEKTANSNL